MILANYHSSTHGVILINLASQLELNEVLLDPKKKSNEGLYLCLDVAKGLGVCVAACDNRTGDAWVEDFDSVTAACEWLSGVGRNPND